MDKLNKELINDMRQTFIIDKMIKKFEQDYEITDEITQILGENLSNGDQILDRLNNKKNYLRNKVHLYLDSPTYDTQDLEECIINDCWARDYGFDDEYLQGKWLFYTKFMNEFMPKVIRKYCENFDNALEIGCGSGIVTKAISTKFKHVTGADLSKNAINLASKNNSAPNISYICKNAKNLHKDGKSYDFVFASDILMYSTPRNIKSTFDELISVLNGGGILLMRESVERYGCKNNLSRGYAAFYRNKDFYTKMENLTDKSDLKFIEYFEGYEYFMYSTNKLFSVFPQAQNELLENPMKIEYYAKNFKSKFDTCRFYYVFKK